MGYPSGGPSRYAPRGFGPQQPEPNGATGIIASVISLGAGVLCAFGAINSGIYAFTEVNPEYRSAKLVSFPLYLGLAALLCLLGGALLLRRTTTGRVLAIATSGIGLILALYQTTYVAHSGLDFVVFALVEATVPLAVLILAALPSTSRWVAAKHQPRNPQPMPYPQPGYGPPR